MSLIVQKFGGTSVGTPDRIRSVAQRIKQTCQKGHQLVVVVSAMGHSTDELIELAHQVSKNPPHREMDMLLSTGERISMALLSMALAELKIPAISLTGSQSGIITDSSHRRARIQRILGDRIRAGLEMGHVVIVAGFQGVSETKEITTLGRGGSDTTAVALAAVLNAEVCEIYTDVDGVFSADPRVVSDAKLWNTLSHEVMVEMAIRGAGVLHPRSVELAKRFGVAVAVKNSFNQNEGTLIVQDSKIKHHGTENQGMEEFQIKGVTCDRNQFLLKVTLTRPSVISALWNRAAGSHLPLVAPVFSQKEVRFFSDRDGEPEWKKLLEEMITDGFIEEYKIEDFAPLSVIGERFSQDGTAMFQILEALAENQIFATVGTASAFSITLGVPLSQIEEGVQVLHRKLIIKEVQ